MPKGPVETPITNQEMAFAHLVLAGTMTDREAAERAGIDPGRAAYVKAKPRVKAYMEEHRASVRAGMVQHEVEALAKFNISREQILAKWWEFANIDPAKGYNTSSQSKALELIWKGMGYADADSDPKKPDEGEGQGDSKPNIYVAKWMRKPGEREPEDEDEMDGSGETGPRRDRAVSDSGRSPNSARPAAVPELPTMRPGGNTMNHVVEPTEPASRIPGASFGRFQGLK